MFVVGIEEIKQVPIWISNCNHPASPWFISDISAKLDPLNPEFCVQLIHIVNIHL